jgi:hypothetical protein
MKIFICIIIILAVACSPKNDSSDKIPADDSNFTSDRISAHHMDYNEYKDRYEYSADYKINIGEEITATKSLKGYFTHPKFNLEGNSLFFTNANFNQIWHYDLKLNIAEKIIDVESAGAGFQISYDGASIYFRNSVRNGKNKREFYSIFEYSVPDKKMKLLFKSEQHISLPVLVHDNLYFLLNGEAKNLNVITNQIGSEFKVPFYYVDGHYLIRISSSTDTVRVNGKNYKFINCSYSDDMGYISALTAESSNLIFDLEGNLIRTFPLSSTVSKMPYGQAVAYTRELESGNQIISSDLFIGFLNSEKSIKIDNLSNELRFNPVWSSTADLIAYSNSSGEIKTIKINFENK